jgi:hypothetical protein
MNKILDFIKNFEPSFFGFDEWDLWMAFAFIVLIFIVINWLTSFLQTPTGKRIKKFLVIAFYSVFIGALLFMLLNALLTGHYDKLSLMMLFLILPYLKRLMGIFYEKYDKLVDRRISGD